MVVINSVFAGIAFVAVAFGVNLLFISMAKTERKANALHITLAFACLELVGDGLQLAFEVFVRSTLVEYPPVYLAWDSVSVTIAFVFSKVAMLNVSLLWIQIADRTAKGRVTAISNVTKYRKVVMLGVKEQLTQRTGGTAAVP
jgi:hypothetical protein